ncbi:substrate-binding periplasmic protein [Colwellia sp. C1TZA3]|uniref:substrate-binding periplasmic protein n=1 Tax=Colwellia sp. C1TZA3 TaxID=2508879 RepID=UPI0011BA2D6D|nr:transporter substrate-binding domain-containing protein [Colwellia sp. C1TZA3]TWX73488.1 amino acid ABC transporter substrate-binding protein [Colwellia sp. C1TZA3]
MLILSFPLASQQMLHTSYYRQNVAPQLFFDDKGRPTSGILFDITHAIASQLDMKLEMIPIPRKRIQQSLIKNIIDMQCAANPKWYKSKALQWSSVIYNNPDILINRQGITTLSDLSAHKSLRIGTVLGYIYPELTTYINNKNILLVTSMTPADSYKQYRKNSVSGFVSASIEASYFFKKMEDSVIQMNNNDIHCVFSPSMRKKTIKNINTVIDSLKASGEIETILAKYSRVPDANFRMTDVIAE